MKIIFMSQYLKPAICIWAILVALLLVFIAQPTQPPLENPTQAYIEFMPGNSIDAAFDDERCEEIIRAVIPLGLVLVCTPGSDENIRRIYINGSQEQIKTVQFYFKQDVLLHHVHETALAVGDLIAWYDRWHQSRGLRRKFVFLHWKGMSAGVIGPWHGLFTQINSLSFY